jgi:hypothetical protein
VHGPSGDRFVQAFFLYQSYPMPVDVRQAVASAFSVISGVSVMLGISTLGEPNIASAIWRTVTYHKNRANYCASATSLNVFCGALDDIDFSEGQALKKLTLKGDETYSGSTAKEFGAAKSFVFQPAGPYKPTEKAPLRYRFSSPVVACVMADVGAWRSDQTQTLPRSSQARRHRLLHWA